MTCRGGSRYKRGPTVHGFSSGIEPFIFKSACAYQWPGVRDHYQAKSVVPKRQAPTSHRDHPRARPAGHKTEKPRTTRQFPATGRLFVYHL
jgi:hypothetical protein